MFEKYRDEIMTGGLKGIEAWCNETESILCETNEDNNIIEV